MADRRYDEHEIGAILQRATEIQAEITPEASGMTLPELQRVAAEVGIEPHVVERAAREVESHEVSSPGSPSATPQMFDQTVEGQISEEQWDDIVMNLRKYTGRPGTTTVQGGTREWVEKSDVGSLSFTASTRQGRTRLRMMMDMSGGEAVGWVIGSTTAILGAILSGAGLSKAGLGGWVALMAAIGVVLFVGTILTFAIRGWRKKARKSAIDLFESLVAQAQSGPLPMTTGAAVEDPLRVNLGNSS